MRHILKITVVLLTFSITLSAFSEAAATDALTPEASPQASPTPPFLKDMASRLWFTPDTVEYNSLVTRVMRFKSEEEATEYFKYEETHYFDDDPDLDIKYEEIQRLTAPLIGVESSAWRAIEVHSFSDWLNVVLISHKGELIYEVQATTYDINTALGESDSGPLQTSLEEVVKLAQIMAQNPPSTEEPRLENGITQGGLFDVLPGNEDVPNGSKLELEFPVVN